MQSMPKQDVILKRTMRIEFLWVGKLLRVHGGNRRCDEHCVAFLNRNRATSAIFNGEVFRCDTRKTRNNARVTHTLKDETLKFALRFRSIKFRELDDTSFVLFISS